MKRIIIAMLVVSLSGCAGIKERRSQHWYEREERTSTKVARGAVGTVAVTAIVGGLLALWYYVSTRPSDPNSEFQFEE